MSNTTISLFSSAHQANPMTVAPTGTGLDQLVDYIQLDPGLYGRISEQDIDGGANAAAHLNELIIEAITETGAGTSGVFTVADIRAMNGYIRTNKLDEWTALHGDDENGIETGFHLVQNDGATIRYRGENLVNTVADGIYHLGFEIQGDYIVNEDGDRNASLQDLADWLTQFYTDRSTTGTGLDRITDVIMADTGLDRKISDADIFAGSDSADGLNHMLVDAMTATGVATDNWISSDDVRKLNAYIRADSDRLAQWTALHGDDEKGTETGFHLVQNDGAWTRAFGENFVNTVADGMYHLGFEIRYGRLLNEDGDPNATLDDVASWLTFFSTDQSQTGTGLDRLVDGITTDYGLIRNTDADDINNGAAAANSLNGLIVSSIQSTGVSVDGNISTEDIRTLNGHIRDNYLAEWTSLHGDDDGTSETGFHLVQGDGGNSKWRGDKFIDTVADGIYHLGFEIQGERLLNEDGDANANIADVATWLNHFYLDKAIIYGTSDADSIRGLNENETFYLRDGNDKLYAKEGNDIAYGGNGDDKLSGNEGNDVLYGENGNDYLSGGDGNDQLDGAAGNDKLSGGDGDDVLAGGDGDDRLYGGDGVDALSGGAGNDHMSSGAGNDTLDGGTGNDSLSGEDGDDTLAGGDGDDRLGGGNGNDQLDGAAGNDKLSGGNGDDSLVAGAGDDRLYGGNGTDTLSGGAGDDNLGGGAGDDTLDGGSGNDSLSGDDGADVLGGGDGDDRLSGGSGADSLVGGAGNDKLSGGDDDDSLLGGDGDDRLYGGNGDDTLTGADGDDTLGGGRGADTLDGGAGNDSLSGDDDADILTAGDGDDKAYGGSGADQISGGAGNDKLSGGDDDDSLLGGDGDDRLYGGNGDDTLSGDAGSDQMGGGNGNDTLSGGDGDDKINGDRGDDTLAGDGGNDRLYGGDGADQISGGLGDDKLYGSNGADVLTGGLGNDQLYGGNGDDHLYADAGNDYLRGQGGTDIFHFSAGWGVDIIRDFANDGLEKMDMSATGLTYNDMSLTYFDDTTVISFDNVSDTIILLGVHENIDQGDFIF